MTAVPLEADSMTRAVYVILITPHPAAHEARFARTTYDERRAKRIWLEETERARTRRSTVEFFRHHLDANLSDRGIIEWVEDRILEGTPPSEPIERFIP